MNRFGPLRRLARRAALTYHQICAREDRLVRGLALPAGVWVCQACRRVMLLDERQHLRHACAV